MSKSIFIKVAIFTAGVATGFLVGKKYYEEYYAQLAQEEIDSVKEAFNERALKSLDERLERRASRNANGMTDEEYGEKKEQESEAFRLNNNPLIRSSLDDNPYEQAKRNYNISGTGKTRLKSVSDEEAGDEPLTDAAGKTEYEMNPANPNKDLPYVITVDEFTDEFDQHDKVSLYYYKVDDVLCDEQEEVINEVEDTVGYNALSALDMQTTVWVRNERLRIDYEIIALNKSYAEQVHGVGTESKNLTPRERRAVKSKKEKAKGRE